MQKTGKEGKCCRERGIYFEKVNGNLWISTGMFWVLILFTSFECSEWILCDYITVIVKRCFGCVNLAISEKGLGLGYSRIILHILPKILSRSSWKHKTIEMVLWSCLMLLGKLREHNASTTWRVYFFGQASKDYCGISSHKSITVFYFPSLLKSSIVGWLNIRYYRSSQFRFFFLHINWLSEV